MKKILIEFLILISFCSFGQELTTIRVTVPNKTDEVFIVGNQEVLGNWDPSKIKAHKISDFEREIKLHLTFPAEFKFTRGSWDNEGFTTNFWEGNANFKIENNTQSLFNYTILSWKDQPPKSGNFNYDFDIENHFSKEFNENRTIAIKLPKNYDPNQKYPVIYVLDANTLFKPFLLNIDMLSEKFIDNNGIDYGKDNIPETILVGIFHNNRGYETMPKFNYEKDKNLFLEGSQKLKNYLFNELVPLINSKFSTANYNCIVGHSNTGHFVLNLPLFSNNPFNGIIALSVNSESAFFTKKISEFLKNQSENVFIGYGTTDNGFNELGELLNSQIKNGKLYNSHLKVESFEATHNQLPALANSSGIKFLFNNYKNLNSFLEKSLLSDFTLSNFIENYKKENEKYGVQIDFSRNELFAIAEMAMKKNNQILFRQIIDYSNQQKDKIENHYVFWLSTEIKDYEIADKTIEILTKTKDKNDIALVIINHKMYSDYLLNFKKSPKTALQLYKNMFQNSNDYKLEFAYLYAKIANDNNIELKEAKKKLDFCKRNFKENRVFKEDDLNLLTKLK